MTCDNIIARLQPLGSDSYKKILFNHGIREPVWGVKVSELKKIQKQVKKDHELSLGLYSTGVYDAQYLAGLIADESLMTAKHLQKWLATANCPAICGSSLAWVAAESPHGAQLSREWIASKKEIPAYTGWATLSSLLSITDDAELDLKELKQHLLHVEKTIHTQPNLVRQGMNSFVIAVGSYVKCLADDAVKAGEKIGTVTIDKGNTACKVPFAPEYIEKARKRGSIGKKRSTARC